jgi:hypothetical protein
MNTDAAEGFQDANPLNRFAIGDPDALKYNDADGSFDRNDQHENPKKGIDLAPRIEERPARIDAAALCAAAASP